MDNSPLINGNSKIVKPSPLLTPAFLSLVALVCSLITGLEFRSSEKSYTDAVYIVGVFGIIWLRIIQIFMLPLISSSLFIAILELKSINLFIGKLPAIYHSVTALIAILIGWFLGASTLVKEYTRTLYNPYGDVDIFETLRPSFELEKSMSDWGNVEQVLFAIFPTDIVTTAAQQNMLGVVTFVIFVGIFTNSSKDKSGLVEIAHELNSSIRKALSYIMMLLPLAIFSTLVPTFANTSSFNSLCQFTGILLGGILSNFIVQIFLVYPILYLVLTKLERNPYEVLSNIFLKLFKCIFIKGQDSNEIFREAVHLSKSLHSKETIVGLILSFGTFANVDAFGLYYPPFVVFLALLQGFTLSLGQIISLIIVGTLGSIGLNNTMPHSGVLILVMMLQTIGIKISYQVGLFLLLDTILLANVALLSNTIGIIFASRIIDLYTPGVLTAEENVLVAKLTEDIIRTSRKISASSVDEIVIQGVSNS